MPVITKKEIQEIEVLEDILCDACGVSCSTIEPSIETMEHSIFFASWGLASEKAGVVWDYRFCEPCSTEVHNFIQSFVGGKDDVLNSKG